MLQPSPSGPSPTASAEESVKNWLAYRQNQKQLPAAESPHEWLAFRKSQTRTAAKSLTVETGSNDGEDSKGNSHRRKNDLTL